MYYLFVKPHISNEQMSLITGFLFFRRTPDSVTEVERTLMNIDFRKYLLESELL